MCAGCDRFPARPLPSPASSTLLVMRFLWGKKDLILTHKQPWTPWALTYLLEIDDSKSSVPAEVILYNALKSSRPNRIAIQDSDVQVYSNCYFIAIALYFHTFFFHFQEEFVNQIKTDEIYFKDGRNFPVLHSHFVMTHKES